MFRESIITTALPTLAILLLFATWFRHPARMCSSSNRHCTKGPANSQDTLELRMEEWVSN
jgi:hypothetical protein